MQEDLLYFEDLNVGDRFGSGVFELRAQDITGFAGDFDPQPFHLDAEAAKQSAYQGLAASGWHTAAITMRLLVEGGPRLAHGLIVAGGQIEWRSPARPGDILHVDSQVLHLLGSRAHPDHGLVVLRVTTLTQHGDVVQTFTANLVVARRGGAVGTGMT
jgi:acyl dehydratase